MKSYKERREIGWKGQHTYEELQLILKLDRYRYVMLKQQAILTQNSALKLRANFVQMETLKI